MTNNEAARIALNIANLAASPVSAPVRTAWANASRAAYSIGAGYGLDHAGQLAFQDFAAAIGVSYHEPANILSAYWTAVKTAIDNADALERAKQDRENAPGMVLLSTVEALGWSLEALDAWATLWASGENIASLENLHAVCRDPIDALDYWTCSNNQTPDILANILDGKTPSELSGNPEISGSTYGLRMAALAKIAEVGRDTLERVGEVDGAIEWLNDTSRIADLVRQYADQGQDTAALETLREYCRGYGKDPDGCADVDELIELVEVLGR